MPRSGSKRSTALSVPSMAICTRSSSSTPRPAVVVGDRGGQAPVGLDELGSAPTGRRWRGRSRTGRRAAGSSAPGSDVMRVPRALHEAEAPAGLVRVEGVVVDDDAQDLEGEVVDAPESSGRPATAGRCALDHHLAGVGAEVDLDRQVGVVEAVDQQRDELADGDAQVLGVVDAEPGVGRHAGGQDAGQADRAALGGGDELDATGGVHARRASPQRPAGDVCAGAVAGYGRRRWLCERARGFGASGRPFRRPVPSPRTRCASAAMPTDVVEPLVLAVAEACNNAILHAAGDDFTVSVVVDERSRARDRGRRRRRLRPARPTPPMPGPQATGRRGLALMRGAGRRGRCRQRPARAPRSCSDSRSRAPARASAGLLTPSEAGFAAPVPRRRRAPRGVTGVRPSAASRGGWPRRSSMASAWPQGDADVVEALEEPLRGWRRRAGTRRSMPDAPARSTVRRSTSTVISSVGIGLDAPAAAPRRPRRARAPAPARSWWSCCGRCRRSGADHGLEAVVHDRPHGVLARRAGAEVGAGDEDRWPRRTARRLSTKSRSSRQVENRPWPKPVRSTRLSHSAGMIWSVSTSERSSGTAVPGTMRTGFMACPGWSTLRRGLRSSVRRSVQVGGVAKVPAMAVAAATAGETRWVRPPRPWRPSKLRLLVEAQRSPGASLSGFMARHIEQPGLAPVEAGGGEAPCRGPRPRPGP